MPKAATKNYILTAMIGLPRSGKSKWALTKGIPIVNPDAIRLALHGKRYIQLAEPWVWQIAQTMVRSLFLAGHHRVILDACNTSRKRRDIWISPAWRLEFHELNTSLDVCMDRAGDDTSIREAIMRMNMSRDEVTPMEKELAWNHGTPKHLILDDLTCVNCSAESHRIKAHTVGDIVSSKNLACSVCGCIFANPKAEDIDENEDYLKADLPKT